jgi:hypothetical protein
VSRSLLQRLVSAWRCWAEGRRQRARVDRAGPVGRAVRVAVPVAVVVPAPVAVPVVVLRVGVSVRRARVVGVRVRVRGMGPRARVVGVRVRVRAMGPRARVAAVRVRPVLVTAPLRATARGLVRRVRELKGRPVAVAGGVVRRGVGAATPAIRGAVAGGTRGAAMVGRRWRRVPLMVRVRSRCRVPLMVRVRRLVSRGRRVVVVGSRSRVTRPRPVVCSGRAVGPARATAQRAMVIRVRAGGRCLVVPRRGRPETAVLRGRRGIGGRRRVRMRLRRV